jgi:hypothetical protein
MDEPQGKWEMVACAKCGLLVGWTREKMPRPFYCIPCFDTVAHIPEAESNEEEPES